MFGQKTTAEEGVKRVSSSTHFTLEQANRKITDYSQPGQTPVVEHIQPTENTLTEEEKVSSEIQKAVGNQETLTAIKALVN